MATERQMAARCERHLRTGFEALIKARTVLCQILTERDDEKISASVDCITAAIQLLDGHNPPYDFDDS